MQHFNAANLMQISELLAQASRYPTSKVEERDWRSPIPEKTLTELKRLVDVVDGDCVQFDLKASRVTVQRLRGAVQSPGCAPATLRDHFAELKGRLRDELGETLVVSFSAAERKLLVEPVDFFGQQAAERFPSASRDMEEASRCLAFGRGTASVFHQLRVLEVGLRALHKALGAPEPTKSTRSWAIYLRSIRAELDARRSTLGGMLEYYETAYVTLLSIEKAWRNPTMHVGGYYTEEEAMDIATHVTSFFRFVASRIDESGNVFGPEVESSLSSADDLRAPSAQ